MAKTALEMWDEFYDGIPMKQFISSKELWAMRQSFMGGIAMLMREISSFAGDGDDGPETEYLGSLIEEMESPEFDKRP